MKILVVEDQDAIRRMIEALVSARGHVVVAAPNGAKALEAVLSQKPDAVLLDINLPGNIDGIEVCRRIHEDPATSTMPIVMISALDDAVTREKAREAGATSYFSKPFSPMALLKEVDAIEARRKLAVAPPALGERPVSGSVVSGSIQPRGSRSRAARGCGSPQRRQAPARWCFA